MSDDTNPKIEVRDLRDADWLWTSKSILFSQYVSDSAYRIYNGLAAYAGNVDQKAWPSQQTLATRLNMSKTTVVKGLRLLFDLELIKVEKVKGYHNIYYLLNCKEVKAPGAPKKEQSLHHRLIHFFHESTMEFRGIKAVWTHKDVSHLKRVLLLDMLTETEMQQLMVYFLASPSLKKFSPSMATFLSPGILNGLMNSMKNDRNFWKDLSMFEGRVGRVVRVVDKQPFPIAKLSDMIQSLSMSMQAPQHEHQG